MKAGIFIVARLGSTRLNDKHFIKAGGKTLIEWLVERFIHRFRDEIDSGKLGIFIATSRKGENKRFEEIFAKSKYVNVFFGSDSNIPLRQLECAAAHQIDVIVSVDGDDILCSTKAAKLALKSLGEGSEFVKSSGLPLGMNVMGYSREFLRSALTDQGDQILETGWGKIFDLENSTDVVLGDYESDHKLRFTLDYPEDYEFFSRIIGLFGSKIVSATDSEIISAVLENNLFQLNAHLDEQYWQNFHNKKTE